MKINNIKYNKALQLKEAGFPQHETLWVINSTGSIRPTPSLISSRIEDEISCPIFEEVIQELGNKFFSVQRLKAPDEEGKWWAKSTMIFESIGDDPLDAVVNLYLLMKENE